MPRYGFLLELGGLGLVLHHFFVPVLVKLADFLDVGHFDFGFLVLLLGDDLLSLLLIELDSHLG